MSYYTKSCTEMGIDERYLSRTHWAQTIATPTGPRDQVCHLYRTDIVEGLMIDIGLPTRARPRIIR